MHELAVAQNIVSIIETEAKKEKFRRVLKIRLSIGEYSGVVPACIEEMFPFAASGTVAEGATLTSAVIPAAIRCADCGYEGPPQKAQCPACGGSGFKLIAGREFFVDSIEVE